MTTITHKQSDNHTNSLVLAWAVLVALTLASWWFKDHGLQPATAITLILVLTFAKVFMVGHSFMEIGRAPLMMRGIFAGWCAGTCVMLVIMAFVF